MKCWECGKDGATETYEIRTEDFGIIPLAEREDIESLMGVSELNTGKSRFFCAECFERRNKRLDKMRNEYAVLKKRLMFERAIRTLEKQAVDIYEYKDIIDDMAEYVEEHPEKFDSQHEMIAAIILVDNAVRAKIQYKIGSYRVDFYIPEYKIILEIDGEFHRNNLYRDNQRDIKIREKLGDDWETVRIGTKYIEKNAKALVDAMLAIRDEKKKLRATHNGYLPEWYAERNKAKRTRKAKAGDDDLFGIE